VSACVCVCVCEVCVCVDSALVVTTCVICFGVKISAFCSQNRHKTYAFSITFTVKKVKVAL
jgi:hypothetical protein